MGTGSAVMLRGPCGRRRDRSRKTQQEILEFSVYDISEHSRGLWTMFSMTGRLRIPYHDVFLRKVTLGGVLEGGIE
jgi:hypothetical protein